MQRMIENELQALLILSKDGGHQNIIKILRHGSLPGSGYPFIDLELCDLDLKSYIHNVDPRPPVDELGGQSSPELVFAKKNCGARGRIRNTFTILSHICKGLTFLHERKYVHRDMKPHNGIASQLYLGNI